MSEIRRCSWVNLKNPRYITYHDTEWGRALTCDREYFELFVLECAQAGLSWETILNKRDGYRNAFHNFDIHTVANMSEKDVTELLANPDIVRNRRKIEAAVRNARIFLEIIKTSSSFSGYLKTMLNVSASSISSQDFQFVEMVTYDLKKRGIHTFSATTCRSYLEACGVVGGHEKCCFLYGEKCRTL